MKFNDVQTLESLLKQLNEYGMTPGPPTYNGGSSAISQMGQAVAKGVGAGKALAKGDVKSAMSQASSPNTKQKASPNVTGKQQPKAKPIQAKNLDDGAEFKDDKGNVAGKVVSRVGNNPNPEQVVVQLPDNSYELYDPDIEVMVDEDIGHDILNKLTKRQSSKKNSIARRIKKLSRQRLVDESQQLHEINFNTKEIVTNALDLPVRCGFEAETSWGEVSGSDSNVDEMSWYDLEDDLYITGSQTDSIDEDFAEWIRTEKADEYFNDLMDEAIEAEREEDSSYQEFVGTFLGPSEEAVEVYKNSVEEDNPEEYKERLEDGWEDINWLRELVDEEYSSEHIDYIREYLDDQGDVSHQAFEAAYEDYTKGEWIEDQWSYMTEFLDEYGIDYSELMGGGLQEIAQWLENWSGGGHVEFGEYGNTETEGWAVETDSSIDSYGTGAEIISPVYDSPREMLEEMKSLFKNLEKEMVDTNRSTGLHVTMSWNGEIGGYNGVNKAEANKLKMATLLGDQYLLDTFGRSNNSYARSQMDKVKKTAMSIAKGSLKDIESIEDKLTAGISGDKFTSVNFKSLKDQNSGYNLIEFRIGGGEDYHLADNFDKVVKAVIRYATVMEAGHTEKFQSDYVKALARTVANAGQISPGEEQRTEKHFTLDKINSPLVDLFKDMFSKENYFDGLSEITSALESLASYQVRSEPDADAVWKLQIKKWEKATGSNFTEAVEQREPVEGFVRPDKNPPSKRAQKDLKYAQQRYTQALGRLAVDVEQGKNRKDINANAISVIRKSLKQFNLSDTALTKLVSSHLQRINIPTQNGRSDQKFVVIKSGLDKLFKKDIISKPNFLRSPQIEKVVDGLWNAVQSAKPKELDELGQILADVTAKDTEDAKDLESNAKLSWQTTMQKREYNDFYSHLTKGGYNSNYVLLPAGEIYNKPAFKDLLASVSKYPEYTEPVTPSHSTTVHSDDSYLENWLNKYIMKMRKRFVQLGELKNTDPLSYYDSVEKLGNLTEKLNNVLKQYPYELDTSNANYDDESMLKFTDYKAENLTSIVNTIKNKDFQDPFGDDPVQQLGHNITDGIREALQRYYITKDREPEKYKSKDVKDLISKRFDAIKEWMTGFDTISQSMGFNSQSGEIASKRNIDDKEANFSTTVRDNNRPELSLPSFSSVFIRKAFFDRLNDLDIGKANNYALANKEDFTTRLNKGGNIIVVPIVHEVACDDAISGQQIIAIQQKVGNDSQLWRFPKYKQTLKNFRIMYNVSWQDLVGDAGGVENINSSSDYRRLDNDDYADLRAAGVGVNTNDGRDGREGQGDFETLIPKDEMVNPKSGEPLKTSSAAMWKMNTDDAEQRIFNAHDWSNHTDEVKQKVADAIKNGEGFSRALDQVLTAGRSDTWHEDNKIIMAAGVSEYDESPLSVIERNADWEGLLNHLGIELGVNNQGIDVFKKVYSQTHNTRAEEITRGPNGSAISTPGGNGMARWVTLVKVSQMYITQNYKVSGGNYFRKDNVSNAYSTPRTSGEPDYDKARQNHTLFNNMMAQGMQNFMQRGQVNNLVSFLDNGGNTSVMKDAVLQAIQFNKENGGVPLDYESALTLGSNRIAVANESVFTKFNKLPLQEQIAKIENIDANRINELHGKFIEGSLNRNELSKDPSRFDAFINKVKAGIPFQEIGGGEVVLHPDMIKDVTVANDLPDPIDIDGNKVVWKRLEKTAEFGSRTGGEKVSNKGEVAEGILGCATFARLLKRPIAPITDGDIKAVMKRLPTDAPDKGGWHELTLTAQETDNPISDVFTLTLNLKSDTYKDFINPEKWSLMNNISNNVVLYVNDNMDKYTKLFARNGKVDAVKVIADGVSGETDTKVDVFLTHSLDGGPEKTLQHFDMSVKVGSTKQMGQVGGGPKAQGVSTERFFILKEMFEKFGADLSVIEKQFMSSETINDAYVLAYTEAAKQINTHLTTEDKEIEWLMQFLKTIKFFATLNDDRVKLVQFEDTVKGGYYVLDFKKLDRMMDKDKVNLEAVFIDDQAQPKITIINTVNNKPFLSIRKKQAQNDGYIRNYIEKEKGLVELIKVRGAGMRKKVESVQEQSSYGISSANSGKVPSILDYLSNVNKSIKRINSANHSFIVGLQKDLETRYGLMAYEARYVIELWKTQRATLKSHVVNPVSEGAVPNNDTLRRLREVLAKPLLTNDLKAQMSAYICIPDPAMIRDFRSARASFGDDHDLRSIVKSYAKMKLHDSLQKKL